MGHAAIFNEFGEGGRSVFANEEQMIIDKLETPAMKSMGFGNRNDHLL